MDIAALVYGSILVGSGLWQFVVGMPPGERNDHLVDCAPANALVYVEWAQRSEGTPGAGGPDGFVADPEIRTFVAKVADMLGAGIATGIGGKAKETVDAARAIPERALDLLGQPGCFYLSIDDNAAEAPKPTLMRIDAALIVDGGPMADALEKSLRFLLSYSGWKVDRSPYALSSAAAFPISVHRHDRYFITTFGAGAHAEPIAKALAGEARGLSASERYLSAMRRARVERVGVLAWIDVREILRRARSEGPAIGEPTNQFVTAFDLDDIDAIAVNLGVENERMTSRAFVKCTGAKDGFPDRFFGRALKADDFAHVPADAELLVAISVPNRRLLAETRRIVAEFDPSNVDALNAALTKFSRETALSIEEDLLPSLGDVVMIHAAPSIGGHFGSASVISIELGDPDKVERILENLVLTAVALTVTGDTGRAVATAADAKAADAAELVDTDDDVTSTVDPSSGPIYRADFFGHRVVSINATEFGLPVTPTYCVTDHHLLVALHPQTIKAQLRVMEKQGPSFAARLESIRGFTSGKTLALEFASPEAVLRIAHTFVPYLASYGGYIARAGGGYSIRAIDFPSMQATLPYVTDGFSTMTLEPDGILVESTTNVVSPIGIAPLAFYYLTEIFF